MLLIASCVLLGGVAEATEVGLSKPVGVGLATGYPGAISVTGSYWLSDRGRISGYLGSIGFMYGLRALYEHNFYPITDEGPGVLWVYWFAGLDLSLSRYANKTMDDNWHGRVGLLGGAGVELQFHNAPAEVFLEVGPALYPVNGCTYLYGNCFTSAWSQLGARWYF